MKTLLRVLLLTALCVCENAQAIEGRAANADLPAQAAAPKSIWPRLVAGMRMEGEKRPEVQRFIAEYRSNPQYFKAMLARAEPFLWFILSTAELRRLPTELALLPAVESSWNAHAVSVSAAQGLWQFIPKTGDAYGLRNGLNYEARRDPVASTRAALDLLAALHHEYGDWPLALAAYNTGGVRLKGAMRQGRSRNFWQLPLPAVTKDYVPRLLAIAALVRDPVRHGLTLPDIAEAGAVELIAIEQGMPLHHALKAAGIKTEVIRAYNPAWLEITAPTHAPTLLLPPADAEALRAELAQLQGRSLNRQDSRYGETALGTSTTVGNAVAPAVVRPRYPRLARSMHWSTRLDSAGELASSRQRQIEYEVRLGDTLYAIAQRHGLSVAELKSINPGMSPRALKTGQRVRIRSCDVRRCDNG
ncbi:MAG: transglycosylase SLT domain-containing protein [Pseudomonadota bacterium]